MLEARRAFAVFDQHGDFPDLPGRAGALLGRHALPVAAWSCASHGQRPLLPERDGRADDLRRRRSHQPRSLSRGDRGAARPDAPPARRSSCLRDAACDQRPHASRASSPTPARAGAGVCTSTRTSPTSSRCAGRPRERRGDARRPRVEPAAARARLRGLDGVVRRTRLAFDPVPDAGRPRTSRCHRLATRSRRGDELRLDVSCTRRATTRAALRRRRRRARAGGRPGRAAAGARVRASNAAFDEWIDALARRPDDDDHRDAARAVSRTPACPGSARRSAATASSPRSSCCGSTRTSRAACCRFLAATQADEHDPEQRRRAGQDPARDARAARWRRCGEIRSAATTAASTPRRSS